MDTKRALPPLTTKQEAELHRLVQAAKEQARPEATRVREQWLDNRVDAELAREGMSRATHPREAQAKRDQFAAAASTNILYDDFNLHLRGGEVKTVAAILAEPVKFDGMRCADPLEPSYGNDDRIGLLILSDGDPRIYSHAHGGQVYHLRDVEPTVQVGSNGPASAKSSAVVLCAADIKPESISWIWDGYLAAGKLHILGGAPGTGKTTLALIIAAIITRGGRYPDGSLSRMGRVLIWSGEDDPTDTIVPRLIAAGADLSRVHILSGISTGIETRPFDPATDMAELVRVVREIGDIRLIIVDPVVSAVAGDSHKNAEVRRSLQPLVTLGAETGAAILGITHFSKGSQGRDATERIVGSIAFAALARVVMVAAKRQDTEAGSGRVFARAKSNIGSDRGGFGYDLEQIELPDHPGVYASRVVWGEAIEGEARDILAQAEAVDDGDDGALGEAESFIEQMMENGPVSAKVMQSAAREAGVSAITLKRAKKKMGILSERVSGSTTAWQWVCPSGSSGSSAPTPKNVIPLIPLSNGAGSREDHQSKSIKGIKNIMLGDSDPHDPQTGLNDIVEIEI
jgi:putative DNA primase/helicase